MHSRALAFISFGHLWLWRQVRPHLHRISHIYLLMLLNNDNRVSTHQVVCLLSPLECLWSDHCMSTELWSSAKRTLFKIHVGAYWWLVWGLYCPNYNIGDCHNSVLYLPTSLMEWQRVLNTAYGIRSTSLRCNKWQVYHIILWQMNTQNTDLMRQHLRFGRVLVAILGRIALWFFVKRPLWYCDIVLLGTHDLTPLFMDATSVPCRSGSIPAYFFFTTRCPWYHYSNICIFGG